jgi:short-subunit dehydrogenase
MKQVVLITGATTGIGKETAIYLAKSGYIVYGAGRRENKLQELTQHGIQPIQMDVTNNASMVSGVQKIIQQQGRIDILINNAGFGSYGAIEDVSLDDAKYQLEVNVFGAARLIQLVLPYMRNRHFGKIVNITSIGGKMATPFGGWYHASKFALEGLSDSLRNEVKSFGIDVIVIEPGGVESEWAGIANENLLKNSAQSAYKGLAIKITKRLEETVAKNAKAIVIAKLIHKAITTSKPKARYAAGYMAKPVLTAKKLLSDRMFDKVLMSQLQ